MIKSPAKVNPGKRANPGHPQGFVMDPSNHTGNSGNNSFQHLSDIILILQW